jgi:hypothetical protein
MSQIQPDGSAKLALFFDRFRARYSWPQTNLGVTRTAVNVPNCSAIEIDISN